MHVAHSQISSLLRHTLVAVMIAFIAPTVTRVTSADEVVGDPPETVPVGEPGSLYAYELTVVNVATNPFDLLDAYTPGLAVNGSQSIIMIQLEATYTGHSIGHPEDDFWYEITDRDDYDYLHSESSCDAWPLAPNSVRIAPGETDRFNLCFLVPNPPVATGDLELVAGTNLITERWPVPFSLDMPDSDDPMDCACLPPPPCGGAPRTPPASGSLA